MTQSFALEAEAKALLERLQRHNRADRRLSEIEIHAVLKEIRRIGKLNLSVVLPKHALERVDRMMTEVLAEARKLGRMT